MEVSLIAARSEHRARTQHIQARFAGPGHYRSHSRSSSDWHDITAFRFGPDVVVRCSCKGGFYYVDEVGSSACKHAVAVSKRLLRRRDELAQLDQLADAEYHAWLDGLRDQLSGDGDGFALTPAGLAALEAAR